MIGRRFAGGDSEGAHPREKFPGIILDEAPTEAHALLHAAAARKKYQFPRVLSADEESAQMRVMGVPILSAYTCDQSKPQS